MIKANFAIDRKFKANWLRIIKSCLHIYIGWKSLSPRYFYKLPERMQKICSAAMNDPDRFFVKKKK